MEKYGFVSLGTWRLSGGVGAYGVVLAVIIGYSCFRFGPGLAG